MKDKTSPTATVVQLDQARGLMHKGQFREALMTAMSALLQALNSLQDGLPVGQGFFPLAPAPAQVKAAAAPRLPLLQKPRILH